MKHIIFFMLVISISAHAEIYKLAIPGETGMKFYWWPVLPEVTGWHHDREHSLMYNSNAQAPDDYTFANAKTVIYAKAFYKPRMPEFKTLEDMINSDHKEFKTIEKISVKETEPLETADGKKLKSYIFVPEAGGNWERVSYGEEGEFYLIFTISSRSKSSYENSLKDYEKIISNYKKRL